MSRLGPTVATGLLLLGAITSQSPVTPNSRDLKSRSSELTPAQTTTESDEYLNDDSILAPLCRYFYSGAISQPPTEAEEHRQLKEVTEKLPSIVRKSRRATAQVEIERKYSAHTLHSPEITDCLPKGTNVKVLTALIPDPIETNLALEFDRRLDALQSAAASSNYVIDGHWLPWEPSDRIIPADAEKRRAQRHRRAEREANPGLLLFRSPADPQKVLLMFLVGESPTAGVNKRQFFRALRFMAGINSAKDNGSPKYGFENREKDDGKELSDGGYAVDVVGPNFSGSFQSLLVIASETRKPEIDGPSCYRISNGTAVSGNIILKLPGNVACDDYSSKTSPSVWFTQFSRTDRASQEFVVRKMEDMGFQRKEIAVLAEGETAFGASYQQDNSEDLKNLLILSFPRNIAHVRNAYQDTPGMANTLRNSGDSLPRSDLPLSLRESGEAENDSVASFSAQDAISRESMLIALADKLRKERIKVALIFATDPLDKLFLLQYLRKTCPDIRIALFDADRMLSRPTEASSYLGTIEFSYYPISGPSKYRFYSKEIDPRLKLPTSDRETLYVFPNFSAEGVYVSALNLLRPKERMAFTNWDNGSWCPAPFEWITVVGKFGLVPIASECPKLDSVKSFKSRITQTGFEVGSLPRLYEVAILLVSCTAFLQALLLLVLNLGRGFPAHASIMAAQPATPFWGSLRLFQEAILSSLRLENHWFTNLTMHRAFCIVLGNCIIATVLWFMLVPMVLLFKFHGTASFALITLFCCVIVSVIGQCGFAFCRTNWTWRPSYLHYSIMATAISISICALWWHWSHTSDGPYFAYRAVHLESGVSPLLPLVFGFICIYLGIWTNGRRSYFNETRRVVLPREFSDSGPSKWKSFEDESQRILSGKLFGTSKFNWALFWGVFLFFVLTTKADKHLRSIEPWSFTLAYLGVVLLCFYMLAVSWVRFIAVWRTLKSLLTSLEYMPIRSAFDKLPKDYASNIVWQPEAYEKSYLIQSRSLDGLRALCTANPADQKLRDFRTDIEAETGTLLMSSSGLYPMHGNSFALQKRLAECAEYLLANYLAEEWEQGSSESWNASMGGCRPHCGDASWKIEVGKIVMQDQNKTWTANAHSSPVQNDHAKLTTIAQEFVALRFVAIIRYITMQMRNLLSFITFGFVLIALSLQSYPFTSGHSISLMLTICFFVLAGILIYVFAGMEKDPIISRISETTAGKLGSDFYFRVASYGALPLLTILAAHFPELGRFLFSWLQPSLGSLK